ncbi:hypothetical protein CCR75_008908 [Bremia lactucae]|uniref:Uncharacterized protein n=1 Tax=Bremia lactucae TaxID=4779 RepID=A0A976FQH5_BRELC|nr:hypothetical protein CCR75_008908 [Bremia lactucae]
MQVETSEMQRAEPTNDLDAADVSSSDYAANESSSYAKRSNNEHQPAWSSAKAEIETLQTR